MTENIVIRLFLTFNYGVRNKVLVTSQLQQSHFFSCSANEQHTHMLTEVWRMQWDRPQLHSRTPTIPLLSTGRSRVGPVLSSSASRRRRFAFAWIWAASRFASACRLSCSAVRRGGGGAGLGAGGASFASGAGLPVPRPSAAERPSAASHPCASSQPALLGPTCDVGPVRPNIILTLSL